MFKYDSALIIDEDPISNFVTVITLEKVKIVRKIKTSINIQHAIRDIRKNEKNNEVFPQLIFLDLLSHEENIKNFIEHFKTLNLYTKGVVKLILVTSGSVRGTEKAQKLGYPYIQKPITPEKIKALL